MRRIYLDNHTVAEPAKSALSAMDAMQRHAWGAPFAPHACGQDLWPQWEQRQRTLYALLGACDEDTVCFTSGAAEGVSHVLSSTYATQTREWGKNHYIGSSIDDAPIILGLQRLERMGCSTALLPVDEQGQIIPAALEQAITPRTALVSLSLAHGLTGVVQPIDEIAAICRRRDVALHLDITHALCRLDIDLEEWQPAFLTFDGASLHAPQGTGFLYVRRGYRLVPLIEGGPSDVRGGHLNLPAYAALVAALEEADSKKYHLCSETAGLRDRFERAVLAGFPSARVLFHESFRLPDCTCIAFPGVSGEALLHALARRHLYATIGGGLMQEASHVVGASLESELAYCAVGFAFSRQQAADEIDEAAIRVVEAASRLRTFSMAWA